MPTICRSKLCVIAALVAVDSATCWAQFSVDGHYVHGTRNDYVTRPAEIHSNRIFANDPPIIVAASLADVAVIERFQRAIAQPVKLQTADRRLSEVMRALCEPAGLPWFIDRQALEAEGVGSDPPVHANLSGVSLVTALDTILQPLQLDWNLTNECVTIGSKNPRYDAFQVRVYPVGDIVTVQYEDGTTGEDFDSLIELITSSIEPTTWDEVGGAGGVREFMHGPSLIVSQSTRVHEQLAALLAAIRKAKAGIVGAPQRNTTPQYFSAAQAVTAEHTRPKVSQAARIASQIDLLPEHELVARSRLRAILDTPITCDFQREPLKDVVASLAEKTHTEWHVDPSALEEAGLTVDIPLEYRAQGITLRSALRQMLAQVDLTYLMRGDSFLITTPERASSNLECRLYYVGDLAYQDNELGTFGDFDPLIEVITSVVQPTTWDEVGGPGSIREFRYAQSLVFSQTQEVHEEVELLLSALRMAKRIGAGEKLAAVGTVQRPSKPASQPAPAHKVHISNQQPNWRIPKVHN